MRYEKTNEYRIQKQGTKGYAPTYIAQRKVYVWHGWNPLAKKPSGYEWSNVVDSCGKTIASRSFFNAKSALEKYIGDQGVYDHCDETVYEVKV